MGEIAMVTWDWTEAEKLAFLTSRTMPIQLFELPMGKAVILIGIDGWDTIQWSWESSGTIMTRPKVDPTTIHIMLPRECRMGGQKYL